MFSSENVNEHRRAISTSLYRPALVYSAYSAGLVVCFSIWKSDSMTTTLPAGCGSDCVDKQVKPRCCFISQSGWSALMAAVYKHHDDIALRLCEAGATPHLQDKV